MKNLLLLILFASQIINAQVKEESLPFQSEIKNSIVSISKIIETSFNKNEPELIATIYPNLLQLPKTISYYSNGKVKTDTINLSNEKLLNIKDGLVHAWKNTIIRIKNYYKNNSSQVRLVNAYIDYSPTNPELVLRFNFINSKDLFYVKLERINLIEDNKIIFGDIEWSPF